MQGDRGAAILHVEGDRVILKGTTGARLLCKDVGPQIFLPGADLSFLL